MAINLYNEYDQVRRESAAATYLAEPDFSALEASAKARGYRKATISEINASVNCSPWAIELFCWCGGLWAKH